MTDPAAPVRIRRLTFTRWAATLAVLSAGLVLVFGMCAAVGSEPILRPKSHAAGDPTDQREGIDPPGQGGWESLSPAFVQGRLPRLLLAALAGAALALAGAVFQGILRNPLAEPYLLGIAQGASVGTVLPAFLGLGAGAWALGTDPVFAFAGSLLALALLLGLARLQGGLRTFNLILTGVILGAFFSAAILLVISLSASRDVKGMMLRLVGDVSSALWSEVVVMAICVIVGSFAIFPLARRLNLLALGEDQAASLGVGVERTKKAGLILASLLTGATVSICGPIGFVGLIVPHTLRLLFGPDHRLLLPAATIAGGVFLMAADTAARWPWAPDEIPVGVITAVLGGPFFIGLLIHRRARTEIASP